MKGPVHIVIAHQDHERSDVIGVFDDKGMAATFIEEIERYRKKRPECPDTVDDTPENNALWSKYEVANKRYNDKHPCPASESADSIYIEEWPVKSVRRAKSSEVN